MPRLRGTKQLSSRERLATPQGTRRPVIDTPAPTVTREDFDAKHRAAQDRYRVERLAAEQRDILAKEKVRLYEIGYQARKAKRDRRAVLDTLAAEGLVLASRS